MSAEQRAERKAINKRRYVRRYCNEYWRRLGGYDSFMDRARNRAKARLEGLDIQ